MSDPFLRHLGLARRANLILVGQDQLRVRGQTETIYLLLMTEDAAPTVRRKVNTLSERRDVPVIVAYDRETLGDALGVGRCSVVGIVDQGFAKALMNKAPGGGKSVSGPEEQGIDG